MPKIHDDALDALLTETATATTVHYCTAEPANYAGVAAVSLGSAAVTFGAAGNATPDGRKRTVTPAGGATYGASGTASHYALVDATRLLAANAVDVAKAVNAGDPISGDPFDIEAGDGVTT